MKKVGIGALGIYVLSRLFVQRPPRSGNTTVGEYDNLMAGYDPIAEAIGCACTGEDGLAGKFSKKFKGALKKPITILKKPVTMVKKDLKKVANVVKRDVKKVAKQAKRDAINFHKPLVRDFKKAAKLMKTDFSRAGAMFKRNKGGGDGGTVEEMIYQDENGNVITKEQYDALMAQQEQTVYKDENGNVITKEQYDALMAQQDQEFFVTPPEMAQGDQDNTPSPTYSMDQVAEEMLQQEFDERTVPAVTYETHAGETRGFDDFAAIPLDAFDTWNYDPTHGRQAQDAFDVDLFAATELPEHIREQTLDVYAGQQTSGNDLIMTANEPSAPYTGDELVLGFEADGDEQRDLSPDYRPDFQETFATDDGWEEEGLGQLLFRPNKAIHGKPTPAVLAHRPMRPTNRPSSYGYFLPDPQRRPHKLLADKRGNVFMRNGGELHRLGSVDALCGEPGEGMHTFTRDMTGVSGFGRRRPRRRAHRGIYPGVGGWGDFMKKAEKTSKKVASYTTPSGFAYSQLKKKPKLYKEYRVVAKQTTPYLLIAGGTALSVVTLGAGSAAGVAAIAAGVAELGAQGYADHAERKAQKSLDAQIEQDRINEAILSNNVITESPNLQMSYGPAAGEIPGGDWPNEYPGDGVYADFMDLSNAFPS